MKNERLHPFLDGATKLLLIDGKLVPALSGRAFSTINPTNGKILAQIAEASAEDIDQAVAAARKAFEGPWSRVKPFDRQQCPLKLADLVDLHLDELAMDPAVPFGGYKMSGYGRESGVDHMDVFLNTKAVWINAA